MVRARQIAKTSPSEGANIKEDVPAPSLREALTFDDVLLLPAASKILPREASLKTRFSRRISLNAPLVSAAMDSVTESELAIAMANAGGIGVIHKNLAPIRQQEEVRKVKKYEAGIVTDPITIAPDAPLSEAQKLKDQHNISGIPVVKKDGAVVGIITNRDMRFAAGDALVRDCMTTNLITAPPDITSEDARLLLHKHRIEKLLIVDEHAKCVGLMTVKDIEKAHLHPEANKDARGRLRVAAALGIEKDMMERAALLLAAGVDAFVLDSAHGHSAMVGAMVGELRALGNHFDIIAGNVATATGAQSLIEAGADAIKVGIGPGSICTTRIVAGVGMPQWSAICETAPICASANVPLIADGGVRHSGDIAKAIGGGADCVMLGSLLAGTKESPGDMFHYGGRPYKVYRGMGSVGAMAQGSASRYFQTGAAHPHNNAHGTNLKDKNHGKFVPEGVEGQVPYKGAAHEVLYQLLGGMRAAMGYIGAKDIKEMKAKARFCRVTHAGLLESHVHDVMVTRQAPNYQTEG